MQTPKAKESAVNLNDNLYETDFYAWTQQQANLLRYQQWNQVDLANLIEEVESLGRKERQELRNRLMCFNWTFIKVGISIIKT